MLDHGWTRSMMHGCSLAWPLAGPWLEFWGQRRGWPQNSWLALGLALAGPWPSPWLGLGLALAGPWPGPGWPLAWPWLAREHPKDHQSTMPSAGVRSLQNSSCEQRASNMGGAEVLSEKLLGERKWFMLRNRVIRWCCLIRIRAPSNHFAFLSFSIGFPGFPRSFLPQINQKRNWKLNFYKKCNLVINHHLLWDMIF